MANKDSEDVVEYICQSADWMELVSDHFYDFGTKFTLEGILPHLWRIQNILLYRIDSAAYMRMREFEVKTSRFNRVSGEFEFGN